jgi:purine-binding chemotaxis protein CheW
MNTDLQERAGNGLQTLVGKHLTFLLGHESYGLPVLKVREIIRMVQITPVPHMPPHVKGVINLRGKLVPVMDLRIRFDLTARAFTESTCIVVAQVKSASGTIHMGFIVDGVEEVLNLTPSDIEETPDFGGHICTDYIVGMAKLKGTVKTLLDIDKVVGAETVESINISTSSTIASETK